jgi:hypothetical protein
MIKFGAWNLGRSVRSGSKRQVLMVPSVNAPPSAPLARELAINWEPTRRNWTPCRQRCDRPNGRRCGAQHGQQLHRRGAAFTGNRTALAAPWQRRSNVIRREMDTHHFAPLAGSQAVVSAVSWTGNSRL